MKEIIFTHKGWFGICPVYFADLESDGPFIEERSCIFLPLFVFSEWFFNCVFTLCGMFWPDFEPMWPLRVTGELEAPVVRKDE